MFYVQVPILAARFIISDIFDNGARLFDAMPVNDETLNHLLWLANIMDIQAQSMHVRCLKNAIKGGLVDYRNRFFDKGCGVVYVKKNQAGVVRTFATVTMVCASSESNGGNQVGRRTPCQYDLCPPRTQLDGRQSGSLIRFGNHTIIARRGK